MAASRGHSGVLLAVLVGAMMLGGCASGNNAPDPLSGGTSSTEIQIAAMGTTPQPRSSANAHSTSYSTESTVDALPQCRGDTSAFELSLVAGLKGAADPVAAARWFVRHGGVRGFGTASTVWKLADPGLAASGGAEVVAGTVSLHAVQFADGTWAIDSGERCV